MQDHNILIRNHADFRYSKQIHSNNKFMPILIFIISFFPNLSIQINY